MRVHVYYATRGNFRSGDKDGAMFYSSEVMAYRSYTLREKGFSTFFAPVTLTLTR